MRALLGAAGRALIRTYGPALLTLAAGLLAAKNLNDARALGVAFLFAAGAAIVRTIQAFFPQFSWSKYIGPGWGKYADAFTQGFLGAFSNSLIGWFDTPQLHLTGSLIVGAVVGALTIGARAVQAAFEPTEAPALGKGLRPREVHPELVVGGSRKGPPGTGGG